MAGNILSKKYNKILNFELFQIKQLQENVKYTGLNLTGNVQSQHDENYKTLLRKT